MSKNTLAQLMVSLTPNEKRNFHLGNMSSKGRNFYQLYKHLEKSPKMKSEDLKKALNSGSLNLSYEKAYLQKMLLRSLRNFHEDSSAEVELQQALINIEILYSKGLMDAALEIIEKAIEQASLTEAFLPHLQLLHWELKCKAQAGRFDVLETFTRQKAAAEEKLHEQQRDYEHAANQKALLISYFIQKGLATLEGSVERIPVKLGEIKKGFERPKSFKAFLQYAESLVFYYTTIGDLREAWNVAAKTLEGFDKDPNLKYIFTPAYVAFLGNYNPKALVYDNREKAVARITEYEHIPNNKKMKIDAGLKKEITASSMVFRFDLAAYEKDEATAIAMAISVANKFPELAEDLRSDIASSLCYRAAAALVLHKKTDIALNIISYCLERFRDKIRLDIYFCFQALYLMAQFDRGNYKILPSLALSAQRYFKSRGQQIQSPKVILAMFMDLAKANKPQYPGVFERYHDKLSQMKELNGEDLFIASTDILAWIDAKLKP